MIINVWLQVTIKVRGNFRDNFKVWKKDFCRADRFEHIVQFYTTREKLDAMGIIGDYWENEIKFEVKVTDYFGEPE